VDGPEGLKEKKITKSIGSLKTLLTFALPSARKGKNGKETGVSGQVKPPGKQGKSSLK